MELPTPDENLTEKIILAIAACFAFVFILVVIKNTAKHVPLVKSEQSAPQSVETMEALEENTEKENAETAAHEPAVQEAEVQQDSVPSENQNQPTSAYHKTFLTDTTRLCHMKDWGVQFKCDLAWETLNEGTFTVSKDPLITINWEKFDKNIRFLGQLNKLFFAETGHYQEGFVTENVEFSGYNAILVKGYDANSPDTQRRDYFYLYNNKLLSVSFRISNNKEKEGKAIIQEIKDSFTAMP